MAIQAGHIFGEDWGLGQQHRGFHFQVYLGSHPEHRMTATKLSSWAVTINILQVCMHLHTYSLMLLTAVCAAYTLRIVIVRLY